MKSASRKESAAKQEEPIADKAKSTTKPDEPTRELKKVEPETKKETVLESTTPDLRTRITNAIKAIRGLGGQIEDTDLTNLTDEELQAELEELTNQYKRLKSSKGSK